MKSASFAIGSASAFVVFAALLGFVPDHAAGPERTAAWPLRGTLAWRPRPVVDPPILPQTAAPLSREV